MVDRKTRETLIFKLSNQTQRCVINLLNKLERKLGRVKFSKMFKTITVDNGSEFLDHKSMERSLFSKTKKRTLIYYSHPYSSWERGTNEQTNGMVRRFVPKGSKMCKISRKQIKGIQTWLNDYPRRIFGGLSANQKKELLKNRGAGFAS